MELELLRFLQQRRKILQTPSAILPKGRDVTRTGGSNCSMTPAYRVCSGA